MKSGVCLQPYPDTGDRMLIIREEEKSNIISLTFKKTSQKETFLITVSFLIINCLYRKPGTCCLIIIGNLLDKGDQQFEIFTF